MWVLLGPVMALRHLVLLPLQGAWMVSGLYAAGVVMKGLVWGAAYRVQNPGDRRWVLRPLMSLLSTTVLTWLLPYSLATLRARHVVPRVGAAGVRPAAGDGADLDPAGARS